MARAGLFEHRQRAGTNPFERRLGHDRVDSGAQVDIVYSAAAWTEMQLVIQFDVLVFDTDNQVRPKDSGDIDVEASARIPAAMPLSAFSKSG